VIVAFGLEDFAANLGHPFLDGAQRADPAAENRPKQDGEDEDNCHQRKRGLAHLLHKGPGCDELIQGLYAAKWADRVQGDVREEGDASPAFCQGMVDRDQRDQGKEKDLQESARPDTALAKKANLGEFHDGVSDLRRCDGVLRRDPSPDF